MSYSVTEQPKRGSVVGNIAKDLGVDFKTMPIRKARLHIEGSSKCYFDINMNSGDLIVTERVDGEQFCGQKVVCTLKYELLLENPLDVHHIVVQILDINNNSPLFPKDIRLKVPAFTPPVNYVSLYTAVPLKTGGNTGRFAEGSLQRTKVPSILNQVGSEPKPLSVETQ